MAVVGNANRHHPPLSVVLSAVLDLNGGTVEDQRCKGEVKTTVTQIRFTLGRIPREAHNLVCVCIYTMRNSKRSARTICGVHTPPEERRASQVGKLRHRLLTGCV